MFSSLRTGKPQIRGSLYECGDGHVKAGCWMERFGLSFGRIVSSRPRVRSFGPASQRRSPQAVGRNRDLSCLGGVPGCVAEFQRQPPSTAARSYKISRPTLPVSPSSILLSKSLPCCYSLAPLPLVACRRVAPSTTIIFAPPPSPCPPPNSP